MCHWLKKGSVRLLKEVKTLKHNKLGEIENISANSLQVDLYH